MTENTKIARLTKEDKTHWKSRLREFVSDKTRELERDIESKVDKQFKGQYKNFIKKLKISSKLKTLQKSCEEYESFINNKFKRERQLKAKLEKSTKDIADYFNRHAKINGWNSLDQYNDSYDAVERHLKEVAKDELSETIKKTSKEGQQLSQLEEKKKKLVDILHFPQLQFKPIQFEDAVNSEFSSIGVVFKQLQLTQK